MKYCFKCGCGLKDGAKFCDECGASQIIGVTQPNDMYETVEDTIHPKPKKKKGKMIFIIIAIIVVISLIIAGIDSNSNNTSNSSSISTTNESTNKNENTTTKKNNKKEKDKVPTIGYSVSNDDVKITFVSLQETTGNNEILKPSTGKVFLIATFEYENKSNSKITISSIMNTKAYVDGYLTNENVSAMTIAETHLDGTIDPGKKLKGSLCYQVDQNWKEYEINLDSKGLFSNDVKFVATRKQAKR